MPIVVKPRFCIVPLPLIAQLTVHFFVGRIPQITSEWDRVAFFTVCAPQTLFVAPVNVAFLAAQFSGGACQVGDDVVSRPVLTINK
ncbi:hypothetical protein A8F97_19910 [Pectobacterium parmentieri]|nr:hypothetical protein A8F97_19910 [Pectobacterium parmentieri]